MNYELVYRILYAGEEGAESTKLFVNTKDNFRSIQCQQINSQQKLEKYFDDLKSFFGNFATTDSDCKNQAIKL